MKQRGDFHELAGGGIESFPASLMSAHREEQTTTTFFDFAAAFLNLSHDYLHGTLEQLKLPRTFIHFEDNLNLGNDCSICLARSSFDGFSVRTGISPLSPLLFALSTDSLLRYISSELPTSVIRAYADDTALVSPNLWQDAPIFRKIF